MDICENESILQFDTLYTNNHIQILKILLPFCDRTQKKSMAVFIKYMELKYTMDHFGTLKGCQGELGAASLLDGDPPPRPDLPTLFRQIRPFLSPSEKAMLEQISSLQSTMKMVQEMKDMMEWLQAMGSEQETTAAREPDASAHGSDKAAPNPAMLPPLSGKSMPDLSLLSTLLQGGMPDLSMLSALTEGKMPDLSMLSALTEGKMPDLSMLSALTGGKMPDLSMLSALTGGTMPDLSALLGNAGAELSGSVPGDPAAPVNAAAAQQERSCPPDVSAAALTDAVLPEA